MLLIILFIQNIYQIVRINPHSLQYYHPLIYRMTNSIITAGLISALTAGAYLFHSRHMNKNLQAQEEDNRNKPVQDIIKEAYIRVSTKENMAVVKGLYEIDSKNIEQILKPYQYTLKTGGKKIRLIMAAIMSEMFIGAYKQDKIPKEVLQVGGLIELLHSASLVIDDIEDGSLQRRGEPCSHLVFGMDRAINAANLMYFLPFKKLLDSIEDPSKKAEILKIFVQEMTVSHMGQAQDVLVHKVKSAEQLPTLEQYQSLTIAKTSSLLRMMVKMLCVLLKRTKSEMQQLCQVMNYVGLAFQVTDDVLNLTKNLGKGDIAEDLKQKKFTPIIHYLRENKQFIDYFVKQNKDDQTIKKMLEMIMGSEVLEKTKTLAQIYEQTAQRLIQNMKTPYSKIKFQKLMKFIITREN